MARGPSISPRRVIIGQPACCCKAAIWGAKGGLKAPFCFRSPRFCCFNILENVAIFQRSAYRASFSIVSARELRWWRRVTRLLSRQPVWRLSIPRDVRHRMLPRNTGRPCPRYPARYAASPFGPGGALKRATPFSYEAQMTPAGVARPKSCTSSWMSPAKVRPGPEVRSPAGRA